jgi:hypothetical protein
MGFYIERNNGKDNSLHSFDIPKQEDLVSNIESNDSLSEAFTFIPGQKLSFIVLSSTGNKSWSGSWSVNADIYNNTYIECMKTRSRAYYKNEDGILYFTHFQGNKSSLLFYFYIAAYKVVHGFYKGMVIEDTFPSNVMSAKLMGFVQDFIAPVFRFIKVNYRMEYMNMTSDIEGSTINLESLVTLKYLQSKKKEIRFKFLIREKKIDSFIVHAPHLSLEARWENN